MIRLDSVHPTLLLHTPTERSQPIFCRFILCLDQLHLLSKIGFGTQTLGEKGYENRLARRLKSGRLPHPNSSPTMI